ncbi:MAG: Na+/H+ antiporter subunit G [Planctomycetes bacterium]|nr:Na+/H+ antiporter subunit G [Planctomycetota bacterium]
MLDLSQPSHLIAFVVMLGGLFFDVVGCLGLVRLPDVYNRLQAGTKCVTLGTFLILLGVLIRFGFDSLGWKAVVCMFFVAMTSPTAAHAIARASHRAGFGLWSGSVGDRYAEDDEGRRAPVSPGEVERQRGPQGREVHP